MAHRQEKPTTSDDSEAEHQEIITGNDGVPTTEEPEQSAEQNKRRASCNDSIENELLNPTCIYFPPPDPQNHFMVQSLDVSIALFNFQRSILNNKWKLTLEDHMHSAMAVHSILFLSMDQHNYDDISTFFNQTMYATIIQTIEGTYGIKKPRFPMDTITKILNIIQDVSTKIISRDKGKVQVPNNLQDLTKLVMDDPLLLLIIDVFERLCIPSAHVRNLDRHRPTIDTSSFNQIFSSSQNRKRLCPLQRNNH